MRQASPPKAPSPGAVSRLTDAGGAGKGRSVSKRRGGFSKAAPEMARGLSLAFEFAGAVFLFWLIGRLVDDWLETEPWFQVGGALIGWVGGFLHVYYATRSPQDRPGVPRKVERRGSKAAAAAAARNEGTASKETGT